MASLSFSNPPLRMQIRRSRDAISDKFLSHFVTPALRVGVFDLTQGRRSTERPQFEFPFQRVRQSTCESHETLAFHPAVSCAGSSAHLHVVKTEIPKNIATERLVNPPETTAPIGAGTTSTSGESNISTAGFANTVQLGYRVFLRNTRTSNTMAPKYPGTHARIQRCRDRRQRAPPSLPCKAAPGKHS